MSGGRLKCHTEKKSGIFSVWNCARSESEINLCWRNDLPPLNSAWNWSQSELWEEHLPPFPGLLILMILGGYMGHICQTSTYLVFRGCCGICSTLALPGQFRANLLQGTLPDWGSATDEVILVLVGDDFLLIQSNWMAYEMWMLAWGYSGTCGTKAAFCGWKRRRGDAKTKRSWKNGGRPQQPLVEWAFRGMASHDYLPSKNLGLDFQIFPRGFVSSWWGWSKCVDYQALHLDRSGLKNCDLRRMMIRIMEGCTGLNVCKWQVLTQDFLMISGFKLPKMHNVVHDCIFNIYEMICVIHFATGMKIKLLDVSKCWQNIFVIWGHGSQNVWKKHPSWGKFAP